MARCEVFRYRQATGECLVEFASIEHDKDHKADTACSEGWGEAPNWKTYRLDEQTRLFHRWKLHHWKLYKKDGVTLVRDSSALIKSRKICNKRGDPKLRLL